MGAVAWAPQFQNGRIPTSVLADYDGLGHFLHPNAAATLKRFSRAFENEFGTPITISEGYRTYDTQVYYRQLMESGKGYPAAVPGTSSHGEAVAADFNSWIYGGSAGTARHNWLRTHDSDFGWSWELVGQPSGESWHFNYVGPTSGTVIGGDVANNTEDRKVIEENDMYYYTDPGPNFGIISGGWTYRQVGNGPLTPISAFETEAVRKAGIYIQPVSPIKLYSDLAFKYGVAEHSGAINSNDSGLLSGRILYPNWDPKSPNIHAVGEITNPDYPKS